VNVRIFQGSMVGEGVRDKLTARVTVGGSRVGESSWVVAVGRAGEAVLTTTVGRAVGGRRVSAGRDGAAVAVSTRVDVAVEEAVGALIRSGLQAASSQAAATMVLRTCRNRLLTNRNYTPCSVFIHQSRLNGLWSHPPPVDIIQVWIIYWWCLLLPVLRPGD
jgi:hypothetical protein